MNRLPDRPVWLSLREGVPVDVAPEFDSIFYHLLSSAGVKGVAAVIVYPMNALINSQSEEFKRYKENYENAAGKQFPISFGQYTGQEGEEARIRMRDNPPHVLLTNYMMLELLLTRVRERAIRNGIYENLRFLVFDELHTYRGRQGADIALLIRRIRSCCMQPLLCIGISATMISVGTPTTVRHDGAEGRQRWSPRSSLAARGMREGSSEPTGRGRLQTTMSCSGKEPGW